MEIILKRGSIYPISITKYFFNIVDYQYCVCFNIYEGENKLCKDNQFLGKFTLENIPQKKRGELIMVVSFSLDLNQILKVRAYTEENYIKKEIIITNDNPYTNKKKIIFEDLNIIELDLDSKERKLKLNMEEYSENFIKSINEDNKYEINFYFL